MCDELTEKDNDAFFSKPEYLSRRQFGRLAAGTGVAMALPPVANAATVTETDVMITTPDGTADCYFVHPSSGKHPAILVWPDILGLRPAFRTMGKRLAESGYAVLVANPFYRNAKSPVVEEGESFSDPETRNKVIGMARALNADTHMSDAKALIGWLDQQSAVDTSRKVGTTGYCMGGPMVMRTAAAVPDRVGGVASFHGGGLVTDREDSPHLLVPKMKASFLIAVAVNDDEREPETKEVLRKTFAENNLKAEVEVYQGAMHGWCPPDSRVYNEEQAEKAWARLLSIFGEALA